MAYQNIGLEIQDGVAVVTINRPKVLNALSPDTLKELGQAVAEIRSTEEARVMVITGAGDKAFVAGADISEFPKMNALEAKHFAEEGQKVFFALEELPIPVIACVNGFALGGGCEMAMSCDFIYASDQAKFGQPEINLGIIPGFGGTQRLSRLVGRAKAKELCMTGDQISAQEAKDLGLVARVFPHDELKDSVMKTAKKMASKGRVALRAVKQVVDRGVEVDLKTGCAFEAEAFATSFVSQDAKEGATAFLEKRKPEFKGTFTS
ncbi:enoyl-CoA hydratase/isomerase family protein [Desulfovermiculus halophilus]|jgi:enoyl-CoA hydratase|uniref:enoyl-CoA hydratase/isomerase family protein n=1 Tax=Desulfovermiculus halophilus TaxID=339722 RepID=UPI00048523FA|nr:enoyl-CoA hydratase-related protein [Desulfovermiculus halophilus]